MANLYHVFLERSRDVSDLDVKAKMDLAIDWLKYSGECWIVWTSVDKDKLKERFSPLVKPNGKLVLLKVDPSEYGGFAASETWAWLRKYANSMQRQ